MIGLLTWLAVGLLVGAAARLTLPGPALAWPLAVGVGIVGGLAGGILATVLGMGGLAELEPRAATLALLSAAAVLIATQVARTVRRPSPHRRPE
ncbi:MAG: hypothetical protein R3244_07840 [Thermoanaerobaculia bacterium]|nr:hypothetical protein [Thermoanaerobaculia bacterium]